MADNEVISLFSRLEELVQNHVVEVCTWICLGPANRSAHGFVFSMQFLAYVAPFAGGLSCIAAGLFHPSSIVRKSAVRLLSRLEEYSVSDARRRLFMRLMFPLCPQIGASIVSGLNSFQKVAYSRMRAEEH